MKVKKELNEWIEGFKEVAHYHQGDYKEGMNRVLQGLETQVDFIGNLELVNLRDFVEFVNKNIWDKPSNTMQQHLEDFLIKK